MTKILSPASVQRLVEYIEHGINIAEARGRLGLDMTLSGTIEEHRELLSTIKLLLPGKEEKELEQVLSPGPIEARLREIVAERRGDLDSYASDALDEIIGRIDALVLLVAGLLVARRAVSAALKPALEDATEFELTEGFPDDATEEQQKLVIVDRIRQFLRLPPVDAPSQIAPDSGFDGAPQRQFELGGRELTDDERRQFAAEIAAEYGVSPDQVSILDGRVYAAEDIAR